MYVARSSLVSEQRHAASLLRGLPPSVDEAGWSKQAAASRAGEDAPNGRRGSDAVGSATVGLCVATPDGLPIMGWHPGFERGRVVVVCSASASAEASVSEQGTSAGPGAEQDSDKGGDMRRTGTENPLLPGDGHSTKALMDGRGSGNDRLPPSASVQGSVQHQYNVIGDGFMLTPLLAKAAADLSASSATSLPAGGGGAGWSKVLDLGESPSPTGMLDTARGNHSRSVGKEDVWIRGGGEDGARRRGGGTKSPGPTPPPQGAAALALLGVDSWGGLVRLQGGEVHRYRSPEDIEREADEREDRRRAMAG